MKEFFLMSKMILIPFLLLLIAFVPSRLTFSKQKRTVQQGNHYKFVWLSKQDWHELEKVTLRGENTTAVVYQSTRINIIHQVQYKNKTVKFTNKQCQKLEEILNKYEKK